AKVSSFCSAQLSACSSESSRKTRPRASDESRSGSSPAGSSPRSVIFRCPLRAYVVGEERIPLDTTQHFLACFLQSTLHGRARQVECLADLGEGISLQHVEYVDESFLGTQLI